MADGGVAIYTNGIMRPNTTPGGYDSRSLAFSGSAGRLYGLANYTSSFEFVRMAVDANGGLIAITLEGPQGDVTDVARRIATVVHVGYPDATIRVSLLAGEVVEVPPAAS